MTTRCRSIAILVLLVATFATRPTQAGDRFLISDADGFNAGTIRDLALSSDGTLLAAAGAKQVRVWSVRTGTLLATLRGYQLAPHLKLGRANAVTFSPDGEYLIVGVSDNTSKGSTRVYRLKDLGTIDRVLTGHTACSDRVAFSKDGRYFSSYG